MNALSETRRVGGVISVWLSGRRARVPPRFRPWTGAAHVRVGGKDV